MRYPAFAFLLIFCLAPVARAQDTSILRDIYFIWDFEKNDNDPTFIWDVSGLNHNGGYRYVPKAGGPAHDPERMAGLVGQCLWFGGRGKESVVSVPYPQPLSTPLTISIWAWRETHSPYETLASNYSDSTCGFGRLQLAVIDDVITVNFGVIDPPNDSHWPGAHETLNTGVKFPVHEWHHLVLVLDEPKATVYDDATPIGQITLKNRLRGNVIPGILFGVSRPPLSQDLERQPQFNHDLHAWNGRMDETAMWTRALSLPEIRGLHAVTLAGKPIYLAKPLLYWWETAVFRTGTFVLIGIILLASIHRLLNRRLRELLGRVRSELALDRERQRIADDIHDELGSRLARLTMQSQLAMNAGHPGPENRAGNRYLQNITQPAEEITRSLDELVWAIKPSNDSIPQLAAYLANHAAGYFKDSEIVIRLDIPEELPDLPVAPNIRHDLLMASKEALTNILKHARATEVGLKLRAEQGQIVVQISDNGQGLPDAALLTNARPPKARNGWRTMDERLKRMGGTCKIISRPTAGIIVELTVPASNV